MSLALQRRLGLKATTANVTGHLPSPPAHGEQGAPASLGQLLGAAGKAVGFT